MGRRVRYTLVIYDISDDGLRLRVADACRDFGLVRIQKSAFLGVLSSMRRRELIARIRVLLEKGGDLRDNVQFFVLEESQVKSRVVLGREVVVEQGGVVYV